MDKIDTLVIGGTGLLGRELVKRSNYAYTYRSRIDSERTAYYLDLSDHISIKEMLSKLSPKKIVLTSAITDVDLCERDAEQAMAVNAMALVPVTEYVKKVNGWLCYISTDYVFDGVKGLYREADEKNPVNVYGRSKSIAENIIFAAGIRYAVIRPSVIYGDKECHGKKNFFLWVHDSLKAGKKIDVLEDQIVSPTLNITLADVIIEMVEGEYEGIFHIAQMNPVSRYNMAVAIQHIFDLGGSINPIKMNSMAWLAKRPANSSLSVEKAMHAIKTKLFDMDESLMMLKKVMENA